MPHREAPTKPPPYSFVTAIGRHHQPHHRAPDDGTDDLRGARPVAMFPEVRVISNRSDSLFNSAVIRRGKPASPCGKFLERATGNLTTMTRSGCRKTSDAAQQPQQLTPLMNGGNPRSRHTHRTPLNLAICIGGVLGSLCVYGVLQVGWEMGGWFFCFFFLGGSRAGEKGLTHPDGVSNGHLTCRGYEVDATERLVCTTATFESAKRAR